MAIAMTQLMTEMTLDDYDQVDAKLNFANAPPDGCIIHTCGMTDGGKIRIFDVWESQDAYDRFREERLMPAVMEVTGRDPGPPPEAESYELHKVVNP